MVPSHIRDGVFVHIDDIQTWLGLPNRAQQLVVMMDPALYEGRSAEVAALSVRQVAQSIHQRLGDTYQYELSKATALDQTYQAFLLVQALINIYGLLALGVVGLLVHTLVMTNVQEQRRDMAILRILGGQRNFLFTLVIAEVVAIGVMSVGLGVALGHIITRYIVVPIIENQMAQEGLTAILQPDVSLTTVLPVVISALLVLLLSTLKPAQDAASTKVMHAINPGVADNIQLEDLAQLRERRPDGRLFGTGALLILIFVLISGAEVMQTFGVPVLEAALIFIALIVMVLGLGLMFFILTIPFERFVLLVMGFITPRLTYFAKRNVGRGRLRNTLISLLVLFSGVLPSFLATGTALENANQETNTRLDMGAPVTIEIFSFGRTEEEAAQNRLKPSFINDELATIPGIDQAVGLTYAYGATVTDPVGMRRANLNITGVDGRLNTVLFTDMIVFADGDQTALDQILEDPEAIIISEGLANYLAIPLGGLIKIQGEGLDHVVNARVVGIARRIPGFSNIGRSRSQAQFGSTGLMSLEGFRHLTTAIGSTLSPPDSPVLTNIMATTTPEADNTEVSNALSEQLATKFTFWVRVLEVQLEFARNAQASQQVFLLILTMISFTTAVFGVFAVIYVTIYARRLEIGMMKAMGMRRWELTGTLVVEAIAMTLSAALAGITAGASMGYLFFYGENLLTQNPIVFAMDTTVMPFIVIMVVVASILGATFSARRIVKHKAVEILRMQ